MLNIPEEIPMVMCCQGASLVPRPCGRRETASKGLSSLSGRVGGEKRLARG